MLAANEVNLSSAFEAMGATSVFVAAASQVFSDAIGQSLGELNMTSVVTLFKPDRSSSQFL